MVHHVIRHILQAYLYIYNSSKDAIPETALKESASGNRTVEPVNIVLRA
jgi:hypothetical protein